MNHKYIVTLNPGVSRGPDADAGGGAVTHVMVNNPRRGYGILMENMLAAAET